MSAQSDCELHQYSLAITPTEAKGKPFSIKPKRPIIELVQTIPIIYNPNYDVSFFKIEHLHPFDTKKWSRISVHIDAYFAERGKKIKFLSPKRFITNEELEVVHSKDFIKRIHTSKREIATAAEVWAIVFLPISLINQHLLTPLKWQVAGSILAGKVALDNGWSINLGGGFHHCSNEQAGGFCLFADITLLIHFLWNEVNQNLNVLIVDLDAHQGNGYARDVMSLGRSMKGGKPTSSPATSETRRRRADQIYIFDMYNSRIYPGDTLAKDAINRAVELKFHTKDKEYLQLLSFHLLASLNDFKPDLVVYNAGTDILVGDRLGKLDISREGVIERDRFVFEEVRGRNIPIVMLTSGGYQSNNAEVVASSIENLIDRRIIEIKK